MRSTDSKEAGDARLETFVFYLVSYVQEPTESILFGRSVFHWGRFDLPTILLINFTDNFESRFFEGGGSPPAWCVHAHVK